MALPGPTRFCNLAVTGVESLTSQQLSQYRKLSEPALAKKRTNQNGRDRLEEAIALMIQNEAKAVSSMAETNRRIAENDRIWADTQRENAERFARIERDMAAIIRTLAEHSRLLERLPEAVRDKIGFQGRQ